MKYAFSKGHDCEHQKGFYTGIRTLFGWKSYFACSDCWCLIRMKNGKKRGD
jgi:hypothetical protein